jgi:hypothetical protein
MSAIADLNFGLRVTGSDGSIQAAYEPEPLRWGPSVLKRESVSLTGSSTFTSLSPPSGASMLVLVLTGTPTGALTLKGVTGDTGIPIAPASGWKGFPMMLPLGTSPALGILNAGATIGADLYWC